MTWTIEYARSVRKDVRKLDHQARERIRHYLEERIASLDDPRQLGDPLRGTMAGLWRYRVGDYRVIAEIQDDRLVVLVVRVGHRKAVYRG